MILIIGAGPIGIEMAIELQRHKVPFRIVEAGSTASTIEWYAPGTEIFSSPERLAIAGVPFEPQTRKAFREDYLLYLRNVVRQFKVPIEHYRRVVKIERIEKTSGTGSGAKRRDGSVESSSSNFRVSIAPSEHGVGGPLENVKELGDYSKSEVETIEADKIILAIGNLHIPIAVDVPGENLQCVSHYMSEPHKYAGTRVMIMGSGNSAAEAAIRLYHVGAHVTLCHRKDGFRPKRIKPWLMPELANLIKEEKVREVVNLRLTEITRGEVFGKVGEENVSIPSDFVLLLTGYKQNTTLFDQLDIKMEEAQPVIDLETMESSIKNVFIIGTAAAGTESGGVRTFIENAHVHVTRVLHALNLIEQAPVSHDRPVQEREI